MPQRLAALLALAAFGVLILASLDGHAPGGTSAGPRVSFQIATGPSGGALFTVGQAIAGLVSHPPGVGRCDTSTVCGPAGVILSARTGPGSFDDLVAVNNGLVDSALVQADMAEMAVTGTGPFRRLGPQRHLRTIAGLFPVAVHLVARRDAAIAGVADLAGKRVALGAAQSDSAQAARAILKAFGVGGFRRIDSGDPAADLKAGKLDAFFLVAGAPAPAVAAALAGGQARLLPIEGAAAQRLADEDAQLIPSGIAANTYPGMPAIATLATRAVWIVNDRAADALVYGLVRALFNPANHAALAASHPAARAIDLSAAAQTPPAPLHSGAARYYREAGKL